MSTDWSVWHEAYERPGSGLPGRLAAVRAAIVAHLDSAGSEPVKIVSACSGDGRDLLGVLAARDDPERVTALLVEYDEHLAARAREGAAALPAEIDVRQADAATSDTYAGSVPADLVLLCGIFGNISDDDVRTTVQAAPQLCRTGGEVIWTRQRWGHDDLTPRIRAWFAEAGFEEVSFTSPGPGGWSVGVHRLVADPAQLESGRRWFTFLR